MNMRRHWFHRQRGDTIVEVLIVIAVISLVLGGAYVTTNKSLLATRSAQERGNALKLAETQIEQIKGLTATNPTVLYGPSAPSPFCISKATNLPVSASNAACMVGLSGDPTTSVPLFRLSVTRNNNDFVLTETWTDVSGRVTDSLQLRYRVYE
jgi:prepilin-type N-terminal cleavage/methylation domain-containing protein